MEHDERCIVVSREGEGDTFGIGGALVFGQRLALALSRTIQRPWAFGSTWMFGAVMGVFVTSFGGQAVGSLGNCSRTVAAWRLGRTR